MAVTHTLVTSRFGDGPEDGRVSAAGEEPSYTCDACGQTFTGPPGGSGLFVWTRGDEVRYEEPPLCERCAVALSTTAMRGWALDDDDEE
jgi:uracil-DNA glycosylase